MAKGRRPVADGATVAVLSVFLAAPGKIRYVAEIVHQSRKRQSSVQRVLGVLTGRGWIQRLDDEFHNPAALLGRPARAYYRLTQLGLEQAPALVQDAATRTATHQGARS